MPSAPNLVFDIPTYNFDLTRKLAYEYSVLPDSNASVHSLDSSLTSFSNYEVSLNGVATGVGWRILNSSIEWHIVEDPWGTIVQQLPRVGDRIRIVGYDVISETEDRFNHLDMSTVLIQGAVPYNSAVLAEHKQFQGGHRMKHTSLSVPKFGSLRYCPYGTGFDYRPPLGFEGIDSFSYRLETAWGQVSDAACISIQIGNVSV